MTCPYLLTANTPETLFLLKREREKIVGQEAGGSHRKGRRVTESIIQIERIINIEASVHFNQTFLVLSVPTLAESDSILFTTKQIRDIGLTSEQIIETVGTTTWTTEAKEHDRQKKKRKKKKKKREIIYVTVRCHIPIRQNNIQHIELIPIRKTRLLTYIQ